MWLADGMTWGAMWRAHLARLLPILAGVAALMPDGVDVIPRSVRWTVLATLRPAEAAARRIVVQAMKALVEAGETVEPGPKRAPGVRRKGSGKRAELPAFPLFDKRKRVGPPREKKAKGFGPNIRGLDGLDPVPPPPSPKPQPDDEIDTESLRRRLASVEAAMADVEGQARRMMRALASKRSRYTVPMRVGRPPGHRARRITAAGHYYKGWRAVDELLFDANWFAWAAVRGP